MPSNSEALQQAQPLQQRSAPTAKHSNPPTANPFHTPPLRADSEKPMFRRLQEKWKVGPGRLALILCTFAIGGSACGLLTRTILGAFLAEKNSAVYWLLYALLLTLLWPVCVMLVSIPLGQFAFFRAYLRKMWRRMRGGRKD